MAIAIVNLQPRFFDALAQLQYDCFPTVVETAYYRQEHFASHYRIFPEGSFVALADERVIGFASGIFTNFDFDHPNHSSAEISGDGFYTTHQPAGAWYYAVDLGIHPDYRRQGIGRRLYEARKTLVMRQNKRGIVAGGLLADYAAYRGAMSVTAYAEAVVAGQYYDSTLTFQLNNGFVYQGLIENYVTNDTDNMATLIVWHNPSYQESAESEA